MKRAQAIFTFVFCFIFILSSVPGFSQPPSSQTTGGVLEQEKAIQAEKALGERIEKPKPKPESGVTEEAVVSETGPKISVKQIVVEGATLLSQQEIANVTGQFEGKELSLRGIQKIADLITDEYRKKGYVTSRAYIPPQTVKNGVVIIRVLEGKLGKLTIQGNRYFKTSLFERKMRIDEGGYFDYSALQRSLVYINEAPDRKAKATLVPGREPGTTDIVLEVKDRFPIHAGFEYDNFGSRYIDHNRYSTVIEDNNLFGCDDKLYYKYQMSEANHLKQHLIRYTFPITETLNVGSYALFSRLKLGEDLKVLDSRGKATIYGLFLSHWLISEDNLDLRWNLGFDYKNIRNFLLDAESSRDLVRVLKLGLDVDIEDNYGRNIVLPEIDFGFPDIMGGMNDKDSRSSRAGAGGRFTKGILTYYRLQSMPWETTLLWKNSAQFTNNNLVASEQFQIGGAPSVRGYPPAERSGDRGLYTSPEISFPIYFLPKDWKVPYNEERFYNTTRLVLFYDWGTTRLRNPQAGEKKTETLRGWGFGMRFNLRDNLSFRAEIGYPLGKKTPSDGDHAHTWIELTSKF